MHRHQHKESRIMKNQVTVTPAKETDKAPMPDPKPVVNYELSDKEFRIILLRKFN